MRRSRTGALQENRKEGTGYQSQYNIGSGKREWMERKSVVLRWGHTHLDMRDGIDFSKSRVACVKDNVNKIWRSVLSISKAKVLKLIAFVILLKFEDCLLTLIIRL